MSAILETQEITETRNGKTSVHRVGPQVVLCAVLLSVATLAFIFWIVALAAPNWFEYGPYHSGLWKYCGNDICMNMPDELVTNTMKGVRAMVILSFLASLYSFVLSILYTFVNAIGKGLVLQLLIAIAGLPAFLMFVGAIWYAIDAAIRQGGAHFGSSLYLSFVAVVFDIVVVVAANMQKNKAATGA